MVGASASGAESKVGLPSEEVFGLALALVTHRPGVLDTSPLTADEISDGADRAAAGRTLTPDQQSALEALRSLVSSNADAIGELYPGGVAPWYDSLREFWENFQRGPVGADGVAVAVPEVPKQDFLGEQLGVPFGVPACAITPHSRYVAAIARHGFDLITYKTVRDRPWDPYTYPNLAFATEVTEPLAEDELSDFKVTSPLVRPDRIRSVDRASFVNSIGVPSVALEQWKADVARTLDVLVPGQILMVSVMGSKSPGENLDPGEFVQRFARVAAEAHDAGCRFVELNLSCPNTGGSLVCDDAELSGEIVAAARRELGTEARLLVKLSYLRRERLDSLFHACRPHINGVVAINAVPVPVLRASGGPFFPGRVDEGGRASALAGLSGVGIRDLGLDMARRLVALRGSAEDDLKIIGVGGVMTPSDYAAYRDVGADAVQSCTGAWLNPNLAVEVRQMTQANSSSGHEGRAENGRSDLITRAERAEKLARMLDVVASAGLSLRRPA